MHRNPVVHRHGGGDAEPVNEIRELGPDDWRVKRDLRLQALLDSPGAFASTYAETRHRDEGEWRNWPRPGSAVFGAWARGEPVGLVGIDGEHDADVAYLFAMWVAPAVRGTGVADALVDAAVDWSKAHRRSAIVLEVTATNRRARRFYARYGFGVSDDLVITEGGTSMRLALTANSPL